MEKKRLEQHQGVGLELSSLNQRDGGGEDDSNASILEEDEKAGKGGGSGLNGGVGGGSSVLTASDRDTDARPLESVDTDDGETKHMLLHDALAGGVF